jgi:predicted permease
MAPPEFPRIADVSINLRTLGFTAFVVMATSVIFAMVPALQASGMTLTGALREASRSATGGAARQRARSVLVTGQIALALVLLIGAGLMIHSFVRVLRNDLGADPTNLLTFDFRLPARESYKQLGMHKGTGLFEVSPVPAETVERVLNRLESVPGVVSVAAVNAPPLAGGSFQMPFRVEGRPDPVSTIVVAGTPALPTVEYVAVTRGFFDVMKIPLRAGRDFGRLDTEISPFVVIINDTMARQYFPGQEAIGQHLRFDFVPDERPREIVGVVGDTATDPFQARPAPTVYVPHVQQTSRFAGPTVYTRIGMHFVIRAMGEPLTLLPSVKRAVAEIDRTTPVANARTVEQTLDAQVRNLRLYMLLLGVFGAVSAVLAATGIYGVMAHAVAERTREIGIRVALGARVQDVLMMVVHRAAWLIGVGLALGLLIAAALARVIEASLFEVTATDPLTYVAVSTLLLLIATTACLVPARRASVVSPVVALKHE